ncbi:MAG TPA: RidA family protein [Dongiaceae bacterium]|jgi:enamine deaminase RidA (YjgF/YER057c/UK114 family)|nr:RidA family protein [Dongiaceae bacterium]
MTKRVIKPGGIAAPASAYNHAVLVERPARTLYLSGQIGERPDGGIASDFTEQARQTWADIQAILAAGGVNIADLVKRTSYVVGREHVRPYYGGVLPPWTLVLVAGLGRPQYLIEVEAIAVQ